MRGLTVAEGLVFLSLASLLAALGMYGIARHLRRAKTAEALGSVTTLAQQSATFYDASDGSQPAGTDPVQARAMRHFPPSSSHPVPADPLDVRGKRYQSSQNDWSGSPWHELRFSMPQPQFYAYSYVSEGAGATARASAFARGDLDADGHGSVFECKVKPDDEARARVDPTVVKLSPED